jgi:hypothetical protein
MDSDWNNLFSVDEILGGLPARRASTLLYAIEGRTAYLALRAREAMAPNIVERSVDRKEDEFLSAMASGAELPYDPTAPDLERYASSWASLVPDDPAIRASLLKLLSAKYRLSRALTPRIQQALGTNSPEVEARFEAQYGAPVSSAFAPSLTLRERLAWSRSKFSGWIERLHPFWISFTLTLTATFGAVSLALPIAFANLGPAGGILIILVLGGVNVLTIGSMAEAVARNGNVRYGQAFFGRLVQDYLGRPGVILLTPSILLLSFVGIIAYSIGLASTLSDTVGFSPMFWVALHFLVVVLFISRDSLGATVAGALVVGSVNLTLFLGIILLTAPHVTETQLRYSRIPFVDGRPFDSSVLALIFGVSILALFGHTSTANSASLVLSRDPSGKSLMQGCMAAVGMATVLYVVWIFVVNGAIPHDELAGIRGTAIVPLATVAGPGISIAGTLFATLAMGMASINHGWSTKRIVAEWLPARAARTDLRRSGRAAETTFLSRPVPRLVASLTPLLVAFLIVEGLLATEQGSFSKLIGIVGVLTVPIISGVFAMMMLAAARNKGDCVIGYGWRFPGHPVVVVGVVAFYLVAIFAHGLVIWSTPVERILAIAVGSVLILFIAISLRSGQFEPRAIVHVRFDGDHASRPVVELVEAGSRVDGIVQFANGDTARGSASGEDHIITSPRNSHAGTVLDISMVTSHANRLKVWVHRFTPGGISQLVAARVTHNQREPIDLAASNGRVILDIQDDVQAIHIVSESEE